MLCSVGVICVLNRGLALKLVPRFRSHGHYAKLAYGSEFLFEIEGRNRCEYVKEQMIGTDWDGVEDRCWTVASFYIQHSCNILRLSADDASQVYAIL
jgi:hypothetical protein